MNKLILIITLFCVSQSCFAFDALAYKESLGTADEHGFSFSYADELSEKVDSVISYSKKKQPIVIKTNDVATAILENGITVHIAAYNNRNEFVITALDGLEVGKQIMYSDAHGVFRLSYDVEWKKDHFIHKYQDCKVISYGNSQTVYIYQ
jgi:hypothetical protein